MYNAQVSQELKQRFINILHGCILQYRLELENIKPSFDVKLRTGLHRGPYKSRRGRRSQSIARDDDLDAESSYGRANGSRASSCAPVSTLIDVYGWERPVHLPYRVARRPDFDENDDELTLPYTVAAATTSATDDQWLPAVENYRRRRYDNPFFRSTIERYASKSGKWLREMEQIDAETRRRKALSGFTLEPTTAHRSRTSDEYNELLSVMAREEASRVTSLRPGRRFFGDEPVPAVDDGEEFLEQLMDRPFARGVRTNQSSDNWREIRVSLFNFEMQ